MDVVTAGGGWRVVSVSCGFRATSVMSDGESNRSTTATATATIL
jgi:hypothetical protein